MNEVNCMSEEELRAHLKKMEKNKEELKFQEQRVWKEEEEEDEQKSILDTIRLRKAEFADEFKRQLQNKNSRIEEEIAKIDQRIREILMSG